MPPHFFTLSLTIASGLTATLSAQIFRLAHSFDGNAGNDIGSSLEIASNGNEDNDTSNIVANDGFFGNPRSLFVRIAAFN